MDYLRLPRGVLRALVSAAAVTLATAVALTALAALEAREDVAPAGAALAEAARSATVGETPADRAAATTFLVESGFAVARVTAADGSVLMTRGPAARWDAEPAGPRAWPARLGADGWALRAGVLEAAAPFVDGGTLTLRTGRRAEHGEVGGLAPIALIAALAGLLAGLARLIGIRRRLAELDASAAAIAALPERPGRPSRRRGEWAVVHREIRRAASRWSAAGGRRGPGELAAMLDPLDHPVATRAPGEATAENPALVALYRRLRPAGAEALQVALRKMLGRRGLCADRVAIGDDDHLDIEAWDAGDTRVAVVTDRSEAERLAALRRRITTAARRHLTAPLHEIRRQAEGLADRDVASPRIVAAADRLESLVDRMLRERGDPPAHAELPPVGLPGLLWGLARRWDEELRSRALRVEVDLSPGLPAIAVDAGLLDEILSELIANAARFSPRGAAITLAAAADDTTVTIAVRDAGPGLDPSEASAAREPFWRGDDAEAMPGAGLGLGVADVLAGRIGGRLEIDPGAGGCVRLVLSLPETRLADAA